MEPKNVCASIGIANSAMLARSTQSFPENDLQLGMRHAPLDLGQDSAALPASNDQSMDIDEKLPLVSPGNVVRRTQTRLRHRNINLFDLKSKMVIVYNCSYISNIEAIFKERLGILNGGP
jgi:hypothetical protein